MSSRKALMALGEEKEAFLNHQQSNIPKQLFDNIISVFYTGAATHGRNVLHFEKSPIMVP